MVFYHKIDDTYKYWPGLIYSRLYANQPLLTCTIHCDIHLVNPFTAAPLNPMCVTISYAYRHTEI